MKSQLRFFIQITVGLFLLAALCSSSPEFASAQTDRQTEWQFPGVPPGYTLIEGDIQMPISVVDAMRQSSANAPAAPQATFNTHFWPNGIVPFAFETNCAATSNCAGAMPSGCVSAARQAVMRGAMDVLVAVANVNFQQCANNRCNGNFVLVRDSTNDMNVVNNTCVNTSANNSAVGMQGGLFGSMQIINIVSWGSRFTIVHELLHALGFFHEQSRPDRGNFVQINCNNVQGGCNGNIFNSNYAIESAATAFGFYDFDSVMHYDQCAFSIDCPPGFTCPCTNVTITVLPPNNAQWQSNIGQRNHLSVMDRASLSFVYPFAGWRFVNCAYSGPSDGSFLRPYANFATAVANTPAGGTLWILGSSNCAAIGTYNKRITVRAAPGVAATLGD